jgi:hypothetical protein
MRRRYWTILIAIAFVSRLRRLNIGTLLSSEREKQKSLHTHDELFISGSEVGSVIPALGSPLEATVHTVFDASGRQLV